VGIRIGEGRPALAARTTWIAFALASVYMAVFAAVYVLLPNVMLAAYAAHSSAEDFDRIRGLVTLLLRFVAFYSFFDAMAIVFGSAVRGAGDTRFSLILLAGSAWTLMVLPTAVACIFFESNLVVCWTACSVYVMVMGVGFLLRFLTGRWKSMRVIEDLSAGSRPETPQPHIAESFATQPSIEPATCEMKSA
jgi:MATE family multidrug resistance protein